jgi:hypothetical protein
MKKIQSGIVGAGLWGRADAEVYSTHPYATSTRKRPAELRENSVRTDLER